jgi:hypothetical protein
MSSPSGYIIKKCHAIAFFILLILSQRTACQQSILDSIFTFNAGVVKTGDALNIISSQTGYSFTYDSRIIDSERNIEMNFTETKLRFVLESILKNDSLVFSVIDRYIIISRAEKTYPSPVDSSKLQKTIYLAGTIIDDETREPLPYASIALRNKGKGTISNNNGEFGLKITPDLINDTLYASYLGYYGREIPVKQAINDNFKILMKREFISIPEIIIRNQIPQEIINKVRNAITKNYGNSPAYLTGFYREGVIRKNELQTYSEAILEIYKSSYAGAILGDQVKVYKSRKIENSERIDTLSVRLKAGLSTCLELDGAKNIFDFLLLESMPEYTFRLTDIVTFDDETAYAIEFEQRENVEIPLFKGIIYINTADYAILNAEFEINPSLIFKVKDSFVSSASKGFATWPISVKYTTSYRKLGNRYFLSHVRGDLIFTSKQKKKLFNTQFKVFFELAITEIELKNVTRFEREEVAPIHSIFSKTITMYDPLFWGNQDFLRPEDNLLKALKNMKVKLQEFSK